MGPTSYELSGVLYEAVHGLFKVLAGTMAAPGTAQGACGCVLPLELHCAVLLAGAGGHRVGAQHAVFDKMIKDVQV